MKDFEQLAAFHRALAEFCRLDMPLGEALREVAKDIESGRLRDEAVAMAAEVESGTSLADAWRTRADLFPPVYAALIETGLASGDLPGTLEEIGRHASMRGVARTRLVRAIAYPVLLLTVVLGISWFLLTTVVPKFGEIFSQVTDWRGNPIELPGITKMMLGLSQSVLYQWYLWVLAVPGIVLAWSYLRRPIAGLGLPFGLGWRLPLVGPLRARAGLLTFTRVLSGLVSRGLAADRALELAAEVGEMPAIEEAARSASAAVRSGSGLAAALREAAVLPPSLLWLVATAERRGEVAAGLAEAAAVVEDRLEGAFDSFMWTLVPVVSLVTGGFVFLVVLAVFYPILKLQSALM